MASTRLTRLLSFLNRPTSASSFPLRTALRVKAISLVGYGIYTLASMQTGELTSGGKPNLAVWIREGLEECGDRWRGFGDSLCEERKKERREARKLQAKERREKAKRMEEEEGKKGIVLWSRAKSGGKSRKPKD